MKPSSSSVALFDSHRSGSSSAGCILSVLRRILCSTSMPSSDHTSPSTSSFCAADAAGDDDDDDNKMMKVLDNKTAVPGLVARMMGLDSIPERRITRSRSLNSIDHIKPQDDDDYDNDQHRKPHLHQRSKSSLSFRETPTYIEVDDDEFIVLKFGNRPPRKKSPKANHSRRHRTKTSSASTIEKEHKQSKTCPAESLQQVAKQQKQQASELENCHQREAISRNEKQIRLVKQTRTSSDSEESSPVSIFDFQEPTSASDDDSWTRSSSSSSRISSPEQDNTKISAGQDDDHDNREETVESRHKAALLNNNTVVVMVNVGQKKKREMWGRVRDITVAEIKGAADADWRVKDLAAEFEVHIMDQLLNDLLLLY